MNRSKEHDKFMSLAIRLAKRAQGETNPNPLVGAVVVKNGKIIGRGYHKKAGGPHAEAVALKAAGALAKGAKLYVTLEPCSCFGRTAPCVDNIAAAQIKEVIVAMADPNPLNHGKGFRFLKSRGIKVTKGVLENKACKINQVFIKYITRKMPFITVKIAQSLDGKIATTCGDSRWISSPASRKLVHKLRSDVDAVLIGIDTLLKDNPLLTSRLNGKLAKNQPKKIIVDSRLRLRLNLNIFSHLSPAQTIIATTKFAPEKKLLKFKNKAQIIVARERNGRVDLVDLFKKLAKEGISHVLIEGGGEVIASCLKAGLVDRMIVFVAAKIIGGRLSPTAVAGDGIKRIDQAITLEDMKVRRIDSDLMIEGRPK